MLGHEAGWGWKELAYLSGAGQAGLEPQIILEIASCSVCNQDQTGSGWGEEEVTVDFCQASLCLRVSQLSRMTFVRATVEMSHHLILSLIIHSPARAHWLRPCSLPLMERVVTNADILTLKQCTDTRPERNQ